MSRTMLETYVSREQRFSMPYEEYRATVSETAHSEWVDGEVTIFMPPSDRHQDISALITFLLRLVLRVSGTGRALPAPFEMKIRAGRSYREPAIVAVMNEHRARLTSPRVEGAADLVFEILSPESRERDRVEKFKEYEAAGITEYWIVDATEDRTGIVAYALDHNGRYSEIRPDVDGRLHSQLVAGFWLDPRWFMADELPSEIDVMRLLAPDLFRG